jgi:hypothetical protein
VYSVHPAMFSVLVCLLRSVVTWIYLLYYTSNIKHFLSHFILLHYNHSQLHSLTRSMRTEIFLPSATVHNNGMWMNSCPRYVPLFSTGQRTVCRLCGDSYPYKGNETGAAMCTHLHASPPFTTVSHLGTRLCDE